MRFIGLEIRFFNEIPDHRNGLMKEISDYFIKNNYHFELIRDESTSYFKDKFGEYCVYVLEENKQKPGESKTLITQEEVSRFLDKYEDKGVRYKLTQFG